MAGRDSLPHFPAPAKAQQQQQSPPQSPPRTSQGNRMYQPPYQQQQQGYQQATPGGYPPGSPVGGYQVGPPGSYGAPPPQGGYPAYGQPGYNANQPPAQRPTSAQPPAGVDPQLFNLFRAADTNGSGQLSERELSRALVNGDFSPFDARTVKLMVKMFDVDHSGTIGLQEFVGLWGYLDQWRGLFRRFDADQSGAIDRNEFANALSSFGYRLSDSFVNLLFASYDKRGEAPESQLGGQPADLLQSANVVLGDGQISFDMFIQSMVTVKTLTDVFKKYDHRLEIVNGSLDTDRDGFVTIGFEQFLEIILRQR